MSMKKKIGAVVASAALALTLSACGGGAGGSTNLQALKIGIKFDQPGMGLNSGGKYTGFDVDVATITGNPAKLELWAMPGKDDAVQQTYADLKPKLKEPLNLREVIVDRLGPDSDYLAVFIPGGHGAEVGIPFSPEVGQVLNWALENDKFVITLCHGPAGLLAAAIGKTESPSKGYRICVFPDALDKGPNKEMGYIPGGLRLFIGEALEDQGLKVVNDQMTGQVHQDRRLLTGDSPLASNNLGLLAADALVEAVTAEA